MNPGSRLKLFLEKLRHGNTKMMYLCQENPKDKYEISIK